MIKLKNKPITSKSSKTGKRSWINSLYIGLITNILFALVAAAIVFMVGIVFSNRYINENYMSSQSQRERREGYLADLQGFVTRNGLTFEDADRIAEWARMNKYVYLLVQKDDQLLYPSDPEEEKPVEDPDPDDQPTNPEDGTGEENPGEDTEDPTEGGEDTPDDKEPNSGTGEVPPGGIGDVIGSLTDSRPSREELIAQAQANGLHEIEMADGTLFVSLTEYTQTLYIDLTRILSLAAACLVIAIILINYFRIIIGRIKKLEKDVNIVSHDDMNHEIVGKGRDEIANLSRNVEIMRTTMIENIKNEQEARAANTELITSISHDIRTPLTVLMGYVEMMKNHNGNDETMQRYVLATENTAQRLKQLSDDMFRYSLAFGDTKKGVVLEEYDAPTLFDQMLAEHILLLREKGIELVIEKYGDDIKPGSTVCTDAQNLMRIVDNVFSNLQKYADRSEPVIIRTRIENSIVTIECVNRIRTDTEEAESNGIGLKTCVRLTSLIAERFEYERGEEYFTARIILKIREP